MKLHISGWWLILLLVTVACCLLLNPTDNSDRSYWDRSGFAVHVDALTGVNYFSTPGFLGIGSSVCVRVDTNGMPVVTKP